MPKQISDLAAKTTAATTDLVPVRDVSTSSDKKITVAGLAPAIASSFASNAVAANAVAGNNLGYAQITTTAAGGSGTPGAVAGLSVSITVPAGGRQVRIMLYTRGLLNLSGANFNMMSIWDGAVNSGTQIGEAAVFSGGAGQGAAATAIAVVTPSAGSKTYSAGLVSAGGVVNLQASTAYPAFLLAELI